MTSHNRLTRREACRRLTTGAVLACLPVSPLFAAPEASRWKLRYALASSLFGVEPLESILAVAKTTGAEAIDLWPLKHGNQREQVDEMGTEKFVGLLKKYDLKLGLTTRFDLGPFGLKDEMKFVSDIGGKAIVTGPKGPKEQTGDDLKKAVAVFHEQLKPHVEEAEKHGIVIAVENHSNMLLDSSDAVRWFVDGIRSTSLGLAFAPYHLPQETALLAELIRHCGPKLTLFYAWRYGKGCMTAQPKEDELEQLPGRGPLDFQPLLAALKEIKFDGYTEVFMHPFPRGIPILENVQQSSVEIRKAKDYLDART
jgi:sugar phosphate isomerase/epimerase